jgi:hypothetical protein
MNKLIEINKEIGKYETQKNIALGRLATFRNDYRAELVKECVANLTKILNEEGKLTEKDLQIFINNMSLDIRDLYLR